MNSNKVRQLQSLALQYNDVDLDKAYCVAKAAGSNFKHDSSLKRALENLRTGNFQGQSPRKGQILVSDELKKSIIESYYDLSTFLPRWKGKNSKKNTVRIRADKVTDKVLLQDLINQATLVRNHYCTFLKPVMITWPSLSWSSQCVCVEHVQIVACLDVLCQIGKLYKDDILQRLDTDNIISYTICSNESPSDAVLCLSSLKDTV